MCAVPGSIGQLGVELVAGGFRGEPPPRPPVPSGRSTPTPGVNRTDARGIEQIWVGPGTFLMGTDETDPSGELAPPDWARSELAAERPQHEVSLSTGYWIDRTEVTNAAYQAFIDDGGYTIQAQLVRGRLGMGARVPDLSRRPSRRAP